MVAQIATVVFALGILALFRLDQDRNATTSRALWIPVVWLLIAETRSVSEWLQSGPTASSSQTYLDGSPLDRNTFAILLAVGLVVLVVRRRQVGALLRANGPVLIFYFYCLLSVLWSDFSDVAFKRWTKAVGDLVMVLIVMTDSLPSAAVKRIIARTAFLVVPISILFIRYYPQIGRAYSPWSYTLNYIGVTSTKNTLGMVTMVVGLGSLWRLLQAFQDRAETHRSRFLIAHGAVLFMVTWLLWIANSATSLSCFVLGGTVMALTSLPALAKRRAMVHLLVASVIFLAFFSLFLSPSFVETVGRDPSLTGRTVLWQQLLTMAHNPLFGVGYESFWLGPRLQKMWSIWWWHPQEAHNGYLEVYLDLGWVGLAMVAFVMVTGYRRIIGAICSHQETYSLRLAYFTVAVIYNMTEHAFRELSAVWIFFLWAIIATPEVAVREDPHSLSGDSAGDFAEAISQEELPVPVALRSGAN